MVVRVRQSVLGGAAHLLNFEGSDTMSAAYHVQYHLNKGVPVTQITPLLSRPHSLPQPTRPDQGGPADKVAPAAATLMARGASACARASLSRAVLGVA